jgi:hypothetical protein
MASNVHSMPEVIVSMVDFSPIIPTWVMLCTRLICNELFIAFYCEYFELLAVVILWFLMWISGIFSIFNWIFELVPVTFCFVTSLMSWINQSRKNIIRYCPDHFLTILSFFNFSAFLKGSHLLNKKIVERWNGNFSLWSAVQGSDHREKSWIEL